MERNLRKQRSGIVASQKMDKTVVVKVETLKVHPKYGKTVRLSKGYMAHDEKNECQAGDRVLIMETKPVSKRKRWRVVKILEKVKQK